MLDNNSCCYFCLVGPESIYHIFGTCNELDIVWKVATEAIFLITNHVFDFRDLKKNMMLDLVNVKIALGSSGYEKLLIYFNTIINHCIWKERCDVKFNFISFRKENIIRRIARSIRGRKNINGRLLEDRKIPYIADLVHTIQMVARKYFPIDNG